MGWESYTKAYGAGGAEAEKALQLEKEEWWK
jgi:hypothetical protein